VTIHVLQGEREVSSGNKSLGQFNLEGIPTAPRGMPQIEVQFDIDANGILHVSAKDKGTGKENKITIKANSGLSEDEIQRMVNDAKANEVEDKKRLEQVQSRNNLDTLSHSVKKSLTEYGDKIDAAEKASIESALKEAEELLKDQNASKEALDAKLESLSTVSQKLGEKMYAAAQAEQAAAGAAAGGAGAGPAGGAGGNKPDDANVVDADFKEVKDDKK
jgi:molecular chaperone DnaK